MKISKPGDNVMVPVPDLDRTKIDAHILPVLIVEEYSNGNGVRFLLTQCNSVEPKI